MSQDVLSAFDELRRAIIAEQEKLARAMHEAVLNGRYADAKDAINKMERVGRFLTRLDELRRAWEQGGDINAGRAGPAIGRGRDRTSPRVRLIRGRSGSLGHHTPQRAYRVPILKALDELGGRALQSARS